MIFLTFILFQNVILYAQTTIDGKIGNQIEPIAVWIIVNSILFFLS